MPNKIDISIEAGGSACYAKRETEKTVVYLHSTLASPEDFRGAVFALADEVEQMVEKGSVELIIVAYPAKG